MLATEPIDWSVSQPQKGTGSAFRELRKRRSRRTLVAMALSGPETGFIMILVVVIGLPIAAAAFGWAGQRTLERFGEDEFSISYDSEVDDGGGREEISAEVREEEIRQMVQARSDRGEARGAKPIDVDAEVERLLAPEREAPSLGGDAGLRDEVRQLVVARNERRLRQGKKELDVDAEVERQLRELENLGQ